MARRTQALLGAALAAATLSGCTTLLTRQNVQPVEAIRDNRNLDEDDPTVHHAFRAATRNADLSVTLICLHRVGQRISLDPEGTNLLDTSRKPDKDVVRHLLGKASAYKNVL